MDDVRMTPKKLFLGRRQSSPASSARAPSSSSSSCCPATCASSGAVAAVPDAAGGDNNDGGMNKTMDLMRALLVSKIDAQEQQQQLLARRHGGVLEQPAAAASHNLVMFPPGFSFTTRRDSADSCTSTASAPLLCQSASPGLRHHQHHGHRPHHHHHQQHYPHSPSPLLSPDVVVAAGGGGGRPLYFCPPSPSPSLPADGLLGMTAAGASLAALGAVCRCDDCLLGLTDGDFLLLNSPSSYPSTPTTPLSPAPSEGNFLQVLGGGGGGGGHYQQHPLLHGRRGSVRNALTPSPSLLACAITTTTTAATTAGGGGGGGRKSLPCCGEDVGGGGRDGKPAPLMTNGEVLRAAVDGDGGSSAAAAGSGNAAAAVAVVLPAPSSLALWRHRQKGRSSSSPAVTGYKSSGWRTVRNIVHLAPFFQTYKKQRYPWVQLAGHQGNFKSGEEQGTILKKLCGEEERCLRLLSDDDALKPFVPEYKGRVIGDDGDVYLVLQDLLAEFSNPCVMDCKMGLRTYLEEELAKAREKPKLRKDMYEKMCQIDPDAPTQEEHDAKAVTKPRYMVWRETISSTATLGFRIDGIKKGDGESSKDFKTTRSKEQVMGAIESFVRGFPDALKEHLQTLLDIEKALGESKFFAEHELIGSSLLFVHDASKSGVWLIDFAKTFPIPDGVRVTHSEPWVEGSHEDGYLIGLHNLVDIFSEMSDRQQAPTTTNNNPSSSSSSAAS